MSDLLQRLQWQGQVNKILTTQGDRTAPVLTKDELKELDEYYESGAMPEEFAWEIMDRDRRAQAKAADLNGDNAASDTHDRQSMQDAGRGHLLK